jgi:hypothetical protein
MKLLIVIFSSLLLSAAGDGRQVTKARWQNGSHLVESDKPFPLARYRTPDRPYGYTGQPLQCSQVGSLRVCKTVSDAGGVDFVFDVNASQIGKWPTSTYTGGGSRFEVLKGDLDGDGRDELIVANLHTVSNGMGIHTWTISVFPDPTVFGFQPPLEFSVEEFGARGTFVKHSRDKRCQILVTEWQYLDHPKRGNGMYIIGRWYYYRKGSLIPAGNRPPVVRRYLYGFAEHVGRTLDDPEVPLRWFKHRQTETLNVDPAALGKKIASANGVIKKIIPSGSEEGYAGLKTEVTLDSGQNRVYQHSTRSFEDTDEYFFRFGSAKFEMIYPKDYKPASLNDWLLERNVQITAYELSVLGHRLGTRQIIWLENR